MWLVLSDAGDASGPAIAAGLTARGLEPVEHVTGIDVLRAAGISHRVGIGGTSIHIKLRDGRAIGPRVRGSVNRLSHIPPAAVAHLPEPDRRYAHQELHALTLSWLAALPGPMLNRPDPRGLGGAWRHPSEWALHAGQAGLPTTPYVESTSGPEPDPWPGAGLPPTVVVVGDAVVGAGVPPAVAAACRRLAREVATPLLGITCAANWTFVSASPRPELDGAALDAVAEMLATHAAVPP